MPGEHRRGSPIRPPRFGKFAQLFFTRPVGKAELPPELDHYREVAGGEHVGPPFREQQIYLRRPTTDALDLGQQGNRFLIVIGKMIEVEIA